MAYILHIAVLAGIFTGLAVSLDLLAGHAGILSIAQAAFYGVGAYASALFAVRLGAPFLLGVLAGMVVSSATSFVISLPSFRLHDDYFVISTFAFQMILFNVFNNWVSLTNGPLGIPGIPQPTVFGVAIRSLLGFFLLAFIFAAFAYVVVYLVTASPFGRVLHAIREDQVFAQSLGKNTLKFSIRPVDPGYILRWLP